MKTTHDEALEKYDLFESELIQLMDKHGIGIEQHSEYDGNDDYIGESYSFSVNGYDLHINLGEIIYEAYQKAHPIEVVFINLTQEQIKEFINQQTIKFKL